MLEIKKNLIVQQGKAKPRLAERGPYVYREIKEVCNVEFLGLNLLRYNPVSTIYFEPTLSNGTESDSITFLNALAVVSVFFK